MAAASAAVERAGLRWVGDGCGKGVVFCGEFEAFVTGSFELLEGRPLLSLERV